MYTHPVCQPLRGLLNKNASVFISESIGERPKSPHSCLREALNCLGKRPRCDRKRFEIQPAISHSDLTDCRPLLPSSIGNARDSHDSSRRFSCCAVQVAGSGSGGIVIFGSTDDTRELERGTALVSAPPMVP